MVSHVTGTLYRVILNACHVTHIITPHHAVPHSLAKMFGQQDEIDAAVSEFVYMCLVR